MDGRLVAASANTIARWCGMRDVDVPSRGALGGALGTGEDVVDLFVLFGGGVLGTVDALAQAMRAGCARRYAIVGGRGRATYWLDESYARELGLAAEHSEVPRAGHASEAEMLAAMLSRRHGLAVDLLETRSTNCGNNITYLLDMLEPEGRAPKSVVLCQDAVMQRRMDATWRRQVRERPAFASTAVVNWAAYQAELTVGDDGLLTWSSAPEGIWPIATYLEFLAGEVARLTDDEHGYGPRGSDFVVHVDVPPAIAQAAELLRAALSTNACAPDEPIY